MTASEAPAPVVGGGPLNTVPDGYYTRPRAAAMVGRSTDTIKRWHNEGRYVARHFMKAGKIKVWLYDDEDIEALRKIVTELEARRIGDK